MSPPRTVRSILLEPIDFSLVLGGPLFQLFRRAHLSGPALELLHRRVLVLSLLAWLPPAILSAIEGHLLGPQLSFVHDVESHVRFLVALPILILAEVVVHRRLKPLLKGFVERELVTEAELPKFYAAIEKALRARNSKWLEVALMLFAYTGGQWLWRTRVAVGTHSWYAISTASGLHLTNAGHYYGLVSIPIFQFIILRWYLRLAIWYILLWRISRLNLRLVPTHPDRAGGIGFLGSTWQAFGLIGLAQSTLLASLIACRIYYQGQSLMSFKVSIAALAGLFLLAILGPLTMFTPCLFRTKREGLMEYGALATDYVACFDKKWVRRGGKGEGILGSSDIQSLADLGSSYAMVREMRLVPFGLDDVIPLAGVAVVPVLPLLLTVMPLDEIVAHLLKTVF
jgi:hypothetical protein